MPEQITVSVVGRSIIRPAEPPSPAELASRARQTMNKVDRLIERRVNRPAGWTAGCVWCESGLYHPVVQTGCPACSKPYHNGYEVDARSSKPRGNSRPHIEYASRCGHCGGRFSLDPPCCMAVLDRSTR